MLRRDSPRGDGGARLDSSVVGLVVVPVDSRSADPSVSMEESIHAAQGRWEEGPSVHIVPRMLCVALGLAYVGWLTFGWLPLGGEVSTASSTSSTRESIERPVMLHYAVVFFVIALIAALFGFTGIAEGAVSIARVLFFVFLVFAIASFIANLVRARR